MNSEPEKRKRARGKRWVGARKARENWEARVKWCVAAQLTLQDIADHIGEDRQYVADLLQKRKRAPAGMAAVKLHALSEQYKPAPSC